MKVSGFTFIKNGQILGYPFLQSIQSILPIVDEFVINVGESEDDTLKMNDDILNGVINNGIQWCENGLKSIEKNES